MNKYLLFSLTFVGLSLEKLSAQSAPPYFQYQAVARDGAGVLAGETIAIQATILKNNMNGAEVYKEEHNSVPTNEFGLFSLKIGGGIVATGTTLSAIDWGTDTYWLRIGFKPPGGSDFLLLNATQLLSVPYALYAEKAGNANDNDPDPTNEIQIISKAGSTVSLSKNGGSFTDEVNDADASPTNELQSLSVSGTDLTISNGNSVSLAGIASQWLNNPTGIHYSGGRVGVRTAAPQGQFEIVNDQELTTGLVVTKTIGNEPIALFRAASGSSGSATSIGREGILSINRFFSPAGNSTFLRFYRENNPKARIGLNAQDELALLTGDSDAPALIVDATSRIGIGTDEPPAKLGIRGVNSDIPEDLIECRKDNDAGAARNFLIKMRPAVPEVLLTTDGTGGHPRLTLGPAGGSSSFLTMTPNENSGINTSTPEAGLDILRSNGAPALRVTKSAGQEHIAVFRRDPAPGVEPAMVITRQGFVGIGTNAPSQELHVIGSISYTGSIINSSDNRYKQDLRPIAGALEKLSRINGRYYHWKQADFPEKKFSAQRQIGVVAQEVEQYFPELVYTDPEGYKSVDYARLTPVLIEAIKEQQVQIEALKTRLSVLEQLEGRLSALEQSLKQLETRR